MLLFLSSFKLKGSVIVSTSEISLPADLNSKLEAVHEWLKHELDGPLIHEADFDIWKLRLMTSALGELCLVSATRCGEEKYDFYRQDASAPWQAGSGAKHFMNTHFHLAVDMATRQNVAWQSRQIQLSTS